MSISPWYALMYTKLDRLAHRRGYALAIHGSMARDLDLVAIPWVEDADDPELLLEDFRRYIAPQGSKVDLKLLPPSKKPHGRLAYTIPIGFANTYYLDISIMPRTAAKEGEK